MNPAKVEKKVRSMPQYKDLPVGNHSKSVIIQGIVFTAAGVLLCHLAGNTSFVAAFVRMYIFFMIINLYDFLIVDCLLFCRLKIFRIAGTENMDKEYKDYLYHFKVFLRGIVFGPIISIIVGLCVCLLYAG